ncbi:MAG: MarR family transcriptional regulator [Armatimonadetes bacterium]|nr:MarR family transcriptional regulator [Armatimonadota bacterium]
MAAIREFNRFYTAKLGLLRKHHLDSEFSLTEARVLFEIGLTPETTARSLAERFDLDPGYLSRVIATHTKRSLVIATQSEIDGREKHLSLTEAGLEAVKAIDQKSAKEVEMILSSVSPSDRKKLTDAVSTIQSILSKDTLEITKLTNIDPDAVAIIHEYYEAVDVIVRDPDEKLTQIVEDTKSGFWVASLGGALVGCVILRPLPSVPNASECKRLYVRPEGRGKRIADRLLTEMEDFAKEVGYEWVYLDTHDGLQAAINLYRKRGYEPCERYNDNPQATVFLRKRLD